MKFLRTATIAAALLGVSLSTGLAADPLGTWRTEESKATVRIAACGPALCGTIILLKEANDPDTGKPKTDKNNADAGLRNRPMIGVQIVLGMKPSGTANKWSGQVYNAEDGKTYSGSLTLQDANTIKLEGCVLQSGDLDQGELTAAARIFVLKSSFSKKAEGVGEIPGARDRRQLCCRR
jgi:uncharacterized protein (DUF2147 family)